MYSSAGLGRILHQLVYELGPTQCFEGFWRHPNDSYPAPYEPAPTIQLPDQGQGGDEEMRPWGRLTADGSDAVVAHIALRQVIKVEHYVDQGVPVVRAAPLMDHVAQDFWRLQEIGGIPFLRICGPTLVAPDGLPIVIVQQFEPLTPPSLRPPEPIEVQGTITRFTEPGTVKAWPMVSGFIVSASQRWPTDAGWDFASKWNTRVIPAGSEIWIYGYPDHEASPAPKLVPLEYRILTKGTEAPRPDDIEFPDRPEPPPEPAPPPEYDDDPFDDTPRPEIDPERWDFDDPRINQETDATPPASDPDPYTGNGGGDGSLPPGGNGADPGTGPTGPTTPSTAGLGTNARNLALASFVLFFLPGLIGDDKNKPGKWDMADG